MCRATRHPYIAHVERVSLKTEKQVAGKAHTIQVQWNNNLEMNCSHERVPIKIKKLYVRGVDR